MTIHTDLPAGDSDDTSCADGWLPSARHCPSPNFGPRPPATGIDLIVVHSISLPPGVFGGHAIEKLFTNQLDWNAHPYFDQIRGIEVSSHFLIRRDGELVQFVGTHERAWHAGASEWLGRSNCNDFSIGIELEGLEGGRFEAAQYRQLTTLCQTLRERHPIAQVVGHEDIAPGRKQDPGPGFDWANFQRALGWPVSCFAKTTPPSTSRPA
jgi:N-acetyl-anhydromuramoyl-L-alanine amidase